jgi:hypothetical protein
VFTDDAVADGINSGEYAEDVGSVDLGTTVYSDYDYFFGAVSFPYHRSKSFSSCTVLDDEAVDEVQTEVHGSESSFEFEAGGKISFIIYINIYNLLNRQYTIADRLRLGMEEWKGHSSNG